MKLAIIILTRNEELHIARAIESVTGDGLDSKVYVVDSGSTDRTLQIARDLGAEVVTHPWENYARQFAWAMKHAIGNEPWVMRLDADEVVSPALRSEIARAISDAAANTHGFEVNRRHVFMGRWVRHGGRSPLYLLRIWRRGTARIEDRWMDEHIILETTGEVRKLRGEFLDMNLNDLAFFSDKHVRYATREAVDQLLQHHGLLGGRLRAEESGRQQRLKRWLKMNIYQRLPFEVAVRCYYFWRMVIQLGFLDGRTGRIYHYLQGYWYRYLVGARVLELRRAIGAASPPEVPGILERLTGLPIESAGGDKT